MTEMTEKPVDCERERIVATGLSQWRANDREHDNERACGDDRPNQYRPATVNYLRDVFGCRSAH